MTLAIIILAVAWLSLFQGIAWADSDPYMPWWARPAVGLLAAVLAPYYVGAAVYREARWWLRGLQLALVDLRRLRVEGYRWRR